MCWNDDLSFGLFANFIRRFALITSYYVEHMMQILSFVESRKSLVKTDAQKEPNHGLKPFIQVVSMFDRLLMVYEG